MSDGGFRQMNGSPEFYGLLKEMQDTHDKKSHDYASNKDPFANYHFAGRMSKLFNNPEDAGFLGRIGEKIFRLANLENSNKAPLNETVEDTELDICVITTLWMASRRASRLNKKSPIEKEPFDPIDSMARIARLASNLTPSMMRDAADYLKRYANDKESSSGQGQASHREQFRQCKDNK